MRGKDEMTATPKTARSGRRLITMPVLLGALAGLALCGLGYLTLNLLSGHQPDAQPTARAICADLTAQRYDQLYTLLDPALQAQGTEAQFAASQRELDQLQGRVTSCAPGAITLSGDNASVPFSLTRAGSSQPAVAQATLTSTGTTWRIAAYTGAF